MQWEERAAHHQRVSPLARALIHIRGLQGEGLRLDGRRRAADDAGVGVQGQAIWQGARTDAKFVRRGATGGTDGLAVGQQLCRTCQRDWCQSQHRAHDIELIGSLRFAPVAIQRFDREQESPRSHRRGAADDARGRIQAQARRQLAALHRPGVRRLAARGSQCRRRIGRILQGRRQWRCRADADGRTDRRQREDLRARAVVLVGRIDREGIRARGRRRARQRPSVAQAEARRQCAADTVNIGRGAAAGRELRAVAAAHNHGAGQGCCDLNAGTAHRQHVSLRRHTAAAIHHLHSEHIVPWCHGRRAGEHSATAQAQARRQAAARIERPHIRRPPPHRREGDGRHLHILHDRVQRRRRIDHDARATDVHGKATLHVAAVFVRHSQRKDRAAHHGRDSCDAGAG